MRFRMSKVRFDPRDAREQREQVQPLPADGHKGRRTQIEPIPSEGQLPQGSGPAQTPFFDSVCAGPEPYRKRYQRGSAEKALTPERSAEVRPGGCPPGAEANIWRGGPSGPALPQTNARTVRSS